MLSNSSWVAEPREGIRDARTALFLEPERTVRAGHHLDPQPLYARLRSDTRLSRIAETGVHLVATWNGIEEVLAREPDFPRISQASMRTPGDPSIFPMPEFEGGVIATADEPIHSVHRGILQSRFSTQSVATLEEAVRRWAREALREWLDGGSGDFVPVTELVPARVVGDLLGLPEGDATRFRTGAMIGGAIFAGNVDAEGLATVATEANRMIEYLGEHLDRANADLRSDENAPLLHPLAAAIKDGRIQRRSGGIAATMLAAGGESNGILIGNVEKHVAKHRIASVVRGTRELVLDRARGRTSRPAATFTIGWWAEARSWDSTPIRRSPHAPQGFREPRAAHVDDRDALRLDRTREEPDDFRKWRPLLSRHADRSQEGRSFAGAVSRDGVDHSQEGSPARLCEQHHGSAVGASSSGRRNPRRTCRHKTSARPRTGVRRPTSR